MTCRALVASVCARTVSYTHLAINPAEKTVTVHALDSGKVYTETYDKLLLAPGAKPTVPALSGVDSERVFTLRTVEDTRRIRRFVEDQKPKTAVLAGGGFIGLEMAENLAEMGVSVTIVQRPKDVYKRQLRRRGGGTLRRLRQVHKALSRRLH